MLNPVSQLAAVRTAMGITGAVTRVAGAVGGQLSAAAGATFKEVFAQSQSTDAQAQPKTGGSGTAESLSLLQEQLLDAVRGALARAGIDVRQSQPFDVVVEADGRTTIAQGHPLQGTLEMVLEEDPTVAAAISRLAAARPPQIAGTQPLSITVAGSSRSMQR